MAKYQIGDIVIHNSRKSLWFIFAKDDITYYHDYISPQGFQGSSLGRSSIMELDRSGLISLYTSVFRDE